MSSDSDNLTRAAELNGATEEHMQLTDVISVLLPLSEKLSAIDVISAVNNWQLERLHYFQAERQKVDGDV